MYRGSSQQREAGEERDMVVVKGFRLERESGENRWERGDWMPSMHGVAGRSKLLRTKRSPTTNERRMGIAIEKEGTGDETKRCETTGTRVTEIRATGSEVTVNMVTVRRDTGCEAEKSE